MLLTIADLAKHTGWPVWRLRRLLKATGAASMRGGRYVTTHARLLAVLPEAWEAVASGQEEPAEASCASCDELRRALLERDRQIDELTRRLGRLGR
jgi:hypothetical protein